MFNQTETEFKESIIKAAKEYAARGWLIFPVHSVTSEGKCTCGVDGCLDIGKHPAVPRGLKEATTDVAKIESWFSSGMRNIGLATGEGSEITVIDVDTGNGKCGSESWAEAIKDHGEPVTLMSQTGSGGIHVFFKFNSSLKTASNVLGKHVDVRNSGGYVLVPPSRHKTGNQYAWMNNEPLATLPAHLSRRKETRGRKKRDSMYDSKYTVEQVASMLEFVPSDDRDMWRNVGIILGRAFKRIDEAWELYNTWADKAGGKKGRNHDVIAHEAFYELSQQNAEKELSLGTIVKAAIDNGWAPTSGEVPLGHFVFYGPGNNYIYRPTTSYWIAPAVDAAVSPINEEGKIIKASEWLKINQLVTSMTSDPSIEEDYLKGHDCRNGEIIEMAGAALFNTYRRPTIELGDARCAGPFVEHVRRIFNKAGDADQFLNYMAHRVQKPWEKPRFALLIAGGQGVGKDTAVEFCCPAIGVWNVANIDPSAFESSFNEFAASTLVRISEAANLHEMSKWAFNERTKVLIAGSPDTCEINPKYGQKYSVRMYCGVIITSNHLASGIYIPPDDRRYDVIEAATMAEINLTQEDARRAYFSDLWQWFLAGGSSHVAAFLHERDLSGFSAANGQRKTDAHKIVVAGGMTADYWLDDILEELGNPDFVRDDWIIAKAVSDGAKEKDVRAKLQNSIGRLEYSMYRNPNNPKGRWRANGKSFVVFAKSGMPMGIDVLPMVGKEMF
jgi:hypothetical protein